MNNGTSKLDCTALPRNGNNCRVSNTSKRVPVSCSPGRQASEFLFSTGNWTKLSGKFHDDFIFPRFLIQVNAVYVHHTSIENLWLCDETKLMYVIKTFLLISFFSPCHSATAHTNVNCRLWFADHKQWALETHPLRDTPIGPLHEPGPRFKSGRLPAPAPSEHNAYPLRV